MRIALATETFPPEVNGVAMTHQRLVRGLITKGHEILLIKPDRSDAPPSDSPSLRIHTVFGVPLPNYAGLKIGLPYPSELETVFDGYHPDLVHIATEGPLGLAALNLDSGVERG